MTSFKPVLLLLVITFVQLAVSKRFLTRIPPHQEVAKMARYVVHKAEWASVGTISTQTSIEGFPFVGLKSLSDGPVENGTGAPYMMMTDMDVSMKDINANNKCTIFVSLAQSDYCKDNNYDPQDPRCARIMLTGSVEKLQKDSEEEIFAKNALFTRHPAMETWPTDHFFFVAKLNPIQIALIDYFGGIKYVSPENYYAANMSDVSHYDKYFSDEIKDDEEIQHIKVTLVNW